MAKGKKKGKGKGGKGRRLATPAMVGTFAGGLMGKVVERVLADAIEDFIRPDRHNHRKHPADKAGEDVAARLLETLTAAGPRSIAQLLADTHLGLSPVLQALHTLRDFRLIRLVGDDGSETVEVTRGGADAVTVFRQNHIREEAAKLLHH